MPLTAAKIAHINALYAKIFAFRSQPVILTTRNTDGSTSTTTLTTVFRIMADADPTRNQLAADNETRATIPDAVAEFLQSAVTLTFLRSVIYLSLPASPPGATPAQHYHITSIDVRGMTPGGDRFICNCMRQH